MSHEKSPIALSEKELDAAMPAVCICCGSPATVSKSKGFWRQPPIQSVRSIGIFGVILMLMQVSDAASKGQHLLRAPFCDKHANYWSGHTYVQMARLGIAGLFIIGLIVAAVVALNVGHGLALAWGALCLLALFACAGVTVYVQHGRIEQMEPRPDFLFLSNASKGFRDAMGARETYPDVELALMQRKQQRWQIANILVIPMFSALALAFVGCTVFIIAPPSGLPQPAGGPQTRGNDLHCYELLMKNNVSHEARSYLWWHSGEAVEGWDHATTVKVVDRLYELGAKTVYYHPVLLLVVLPKDAEARRRIFQWVFEDIKKQKGQPTPDEQQWYLLVSPK